MSGNGYAGQGSNFGIGVFGVENEIVENTALGNANGIVLFVNGVRNLLLRNIVMGNPPVQISVNNPTTTGVDIRNDAPPGENTFLGNICMTSVGAVCSLFADPPERR